MKITEYRGVEGLVYAEVTEDSSTTYTTGAVKELAGVAEISRSTESSSAAHYYDNVPAVVIESTGADEITAAVSAIPLEALAEITGQHYDPTLGMLVEGERTSKYFALGYRTKKTDGTEVLVWRLKGTFSIPGSTHHTEDDGTDANGQEITFTGIATTFKFNKTGKRAKAINIDTGLDLADVTTFFDTVTTPDSIKPKSKV